MSVLLSAAIISLLTRSTLSIDVQVNWQIPEQPFDPITARVGDTITFLNFTDNSHNVHIHPSGTCDDTDAINIGSTSPTKYTFEKVGEYTFACDVSSGIHCTLGQIITVSVTSNSSPNGNENGNHEKTKLPLKMNQENASSDNDAIFNESEADLLKKYREFFNPGEERGVLEFRIKPYKIPHETTTYIDFVFNLPEDFADIVHIVTGDVIVSQPKHLHHFVITGCTELIDPSLEGLPLEEVPESCSLPLGVWAVGGDLYGGYTLDTGLLFGRGLGVNAISLNIHYTDGDEIDTKYENDGIKAIATDGIRILYTPNLRPKTIFLKPLINAFVGPEAMYIPPNTPRYFYTKTCSVESTCQDTDDEKKQISEDWCSPSKEDNNPNEYLIGAVNYHSHLTAREMYTTLLPNSDDSSSIDLESKDLWLYDNQVTYPFHDDQNDKPYFKVYPKDKIQVTCIYDTTSRNYATQFNLSTYDEMCLTQVHVLLDTPNITSEDSQSLISMVYLRSFTCAVDENSDIWSGFLEANEDARDIWINHPMSEANCTFPVGTPSGISGNIVTLTGDTSLTHEVRCASMDKSDDLNHGSSGPVTDSSSFLSLLMIVSCFLVTFLCV